MDIRKIKKLIEMLEESNLAEIEIHEGEESVRLSRQPQSSAAMNWYAPPALPAHALNVNPGSETGPAVQEHPPSLRHFLKSPMVGTFYRAASPGATPLVEIGQEVKTGDPVCIIEAMKMFNQIEADRDGVIADVLVENGHPVEYDQPLFVIK